MERERFEIRSLTSTLLTYLQGKGYNIDRVEEAFIKDVPLTVPAVGVHFLQSRIEERQMGRDKKAFKRPVQVDVYMESKTRADAILDEIADFMDEQTISIYNQSNNLIGYMTCFDSESITLDSLAPLGNTPELIKWRGVAKCVYDVDYVV